MERNVRLWSDCYGLQKRERERKRILGEGRGLLFYNSCILMCYGHEVSYISRFDISISATAILARMPFSLTNLAMSYAKSISY